jgi:hypothetical protein
MAAVFAVSSQAVMVVFWQVQQIYVGNGIALFLQFYGCIVC